MRGLAAEAMAAESGHLLSSKGQPIYQQFVTACEEGGMLNLSVGGLRPAAGATRHILRYSHATHLLQVGASP